MRRPVTCLLLIAIAAACAPKSADEGAQAPSADSAAALRLIDSLKAVARDSIAARDSAASKAPTKTPTKTPTNAPAAGKIIGRDSAFGPTYTVDSTGKVVPIVPAKKKP